MKNFKKFAAMVKALTLAACAVAPLTMTSSLAADSYSITINNTETDHVYTAYTIFTATSIDNDNVLGGIAWGDIDDKKEVDGKTIYGALKAAGITYDKNGTNENPFEKTINVEDTPTVVALETALEVAGALSHVTSNTNTTRADIDNIADILAKYFKDSPSTVNSGACTDDKYVIQLANPGYYLVIDNDATETPTDNPLAQGEALSRYILQVAGNASVSKKSSAPNVQKKVLENTKDVTGATFTSGTTTVTESEKWNDVADYNIGDAVPFKLYGSMPETIDDYEHYKYIFHDKLGREFTLAPQGTVDVGDAEVADTTFDNDGDDIVVKIVKGSTEIVIPKDQYSYIASPSDDGCTFEINFADIKNIKDLSNAAIAIDANCVVTVEYKAILNDKAVIGTPGQENEVRLEYTNNPRWDGVADSDTDETSKTKEDRVIVFTYQLDITKYLGDEATTAEASGDKMAGFKLKATSGEHNGKYAIILSGKVTGWAEADGTELKTDGSGQFTIKGLDDGTYLLSETTVPKGYNPMSPLTLIVDATTTNGQKYMDTIGTDEPIEMLTALNLYEKEKSSTAKNTAVNTGNNANGVVKDSIVNQKGNSLPSTGGVGTTIFYLGGGAMVAVAGVFLITKKRMGKREE